MKDKIRNNFNVSIAEIDHEDKWQRASLAVSTVSNEKKHVESTLSKVINRINANYRVEITNTTITFL